MPRREAASCSSSGTARLELGASARPLHDARGNHLQAPPRGFENGGRFVCEEAIGTSAVGGQRNAPRQLVHAGLERVDRHVDGVGQVACGKLLFGTDVKQNELPFRGVVNRVLNSQGGGRNAAFGLKGGEFGEALLGRFADHDGQGGHLGAR